MLSFLFRCWIFIVVVYFRLVFGSFGQVSSGEYTALEDLYQSTNGSQWRWKDITLFGPIWFNNSITPCSTPPWQGLTCDCNSSMTCVIEEITLVDYDLNGELPDTIDNFVNLTVLDLSRNRLEGSIPESIGSLQMLEELTFSFNNLGGSLPNGLFDLKNLIFLSLDWNAYEGTLSPLIGNLESLEMLLLNSNGFHGTFPVEVYDLPKLIVLDAHYNSFEGTLSPSVANAQSLMHLDFSINNLRGHLPIELAELPHLQSLLIGYNFFSGSIDNIYNCTELLIFVAQENFLTGTLSDAIAQLTKARYIYLDFNLISGSLPTALFNMTELSHLYLNNMNMNGTLPEALFRMPAMERLLLYNNLFTGTLPNNLGDAIHMLELDVGNNYFTSTIPNSIGGMEYLKLFQLDYNILWGTIPSSIGSMSILKLLNAGGNYLSGSIPSALFDCTKLRFLSLENNFLSGSISDELGKLRILDIMQLSTNKLNGSIPSNVGNMRFLTSFKVNENQLTGSIPNSLWYCQNLTDIEISYNYLTGSLSSSIGNLSSTLSVIIFSGNQMTGSLPEEIGVLTHMVAFEGLDNQITGTIPTALCLYEGGDFLMQYNLLSGSIPECVFKIYSLVELTVHDNLLTGTIPSNFTNTALTNILLYENFLSGRLPLRTSEYVVYFEVYVNKFTGTLPDDLFSVGAYLQLALDTNYLTGTIPKTLNNATTLNYISLYKNHLTGTLPYIGDLRALSIMYADSNMLTGSLTCFNSRTQLYLANVDVSDNQFTGTLPEELFLLPQIESVAIVQNCFTGTIPEIICNATVMTALALDGLHTASSCRYNLIGSNYALRYHTPGSIPTCLFNMPALQTLHMSGNGIGGSLPYNLSIAWPLTDIALSYNQITGPIPLELQLKSFFNYDLSFNNFDGILLPFTAAVPLNGSVFLRVNRLSGKIPPLLRDIDTISILNSNIFECQLDRTQLPKNDDQAFYYECGTNSLQHSVYVFVGFVLLLLLVALVLYFFAREIVKSSSRWTEWIQKIVDNGRRYWANIHTVRRESHNITLMNKYIENLRYYTLLMTAFVTLVLMPIYIALSQYYSMYQYKYAWNVSSVYLSGVVPAVILFISFIALTAVIYGGIFMIGRDFRTIDVVVSRKTTVVEVVQEKSKHYVGLFLIAVFNISIVLAVNVAYVIASTHLNPQTVTLVQLMLASFKLFWNDLVVRGLTRVLHRLCTQSVTLSMAEERLWDSRYLTFNAYMLLFNVIIIPCVATAAVSSDCFYNTYVAPLNVVSTISYQICDDFQTVISQSLSPNCSSYSVSTYTTSFLPPYIYRYKCASTLVTTYTIVYVYKFIFAAFLQPCLLMYLLRLCEHCSPGTTLYEFVNNVVLQVKHSAPAEKLERAYIFQADRFNLRLIMYLAVFVTFGAIFPPLAVMICIAVYTQTLWVQVSLGRLLTVSADQPHWKMVLNSMNQDMVNIGVMFKNTVYVIGGPAAFFYAYFLFDTYGDAVGARKALWMTFTMLAIGLLAMVGYQYAVKRRGWKNNDGVEDDKIELYGRPSTMHMNSSSTVSFAVSGGGRSSLNPLSIGRGSSEIEQDKVETVIKETL